ncbi:hypothetical protein CH330_05575 [candidate division WOR-3 bacterium JGI_Cruoil_03_51_56]|uniref:Uncharacterized protein n=1 Tax=candidate division WOR-3 bacterium JGI_Cruoil_03_51_56 TaxID=1973747 RepID=A0A235BTF7_UNCW3|nr:MAG: hypothetical protein CH330_05575 [candidate division WOR-3 bacterium JGI_Cruoil_03_51_56]
MRFSRSFLFGSTGPNSTKLLLDKKPGGYKIIMLASVVSNICQQATVSMGYRIPWPFSGPGYYCLI